MPKVSTHVRAVVVASIIFMSTATQAQRGVAPAQPPPEEEPELSWPEDIRHLHWSEYVVAPLLVGGAFSLYLLPPSPSTDGSNLTGFDLSIQRRIRIENEGGRSFVKALGNIGFIGTFAYRAFDDLVMAGAVRGGWDVAWQLAVIDATAFGFSGAVTWGAQALYGRQRPSYHFCEEEMGVGHPDCDDGDRTNRSLISGHLSISVTGAALTCLHHSRLRIYGNQRRGRAACVSHAVMAGLTGIARATRDDHWATDIFMGTALGVVSGWLIPRLLYYGFDEFGFGHGNWDEDGQTRSRSSLRVAVVPQVSANQAGLGAMGAW